MSSKRGIPACGYSRTICTDPCRCFGRMKCSQSSAFHSIVKSLRRAGPSALNPTTKNGSRRRQSVLYAGRSYRQRGEPIHLAGNGPDRNARNARTAGQPDRKELLPLENALTPVLRTSAESRKLLNLSPFRCSFPWSAEVWDRAGA